MCVDGSSSGNADPLHANLAQLLWAAASAHGDHPAVIERDRTISYSALRMYAASVAAALAARGSTPDDRVAILLERGADAVAALFGAYATGAIAIVVNERLRPRQVEYVLRHAAVKTLVTSAEMLSRLPRALETDATIVDVGNARVSGAFEPMPRLATDMAQIIYTSGSTGLPKGVTFGNASLWTGIRSVSGYLDLTADDRVAGLLPLSSVYGLNQLLCAVLCGATLVVERSPLPNQVVASLRALGVTVVAGVPPLWLQLLSVPDFRKQALPSLRQMQNAGGHLPTEAVRRLRQAHPHAQLILQYGQTETFRGTYLPPEEVDRRPNSMGRAIPGVEILVLGEGATRCRPGEIGELVHRGPTIAAGYWNDPEATAAVFRPNPLRPAGAPDGERVVFSGDMVRTDEEGFLYFVSRRDRMIKTMGYRVGPDEIADVLHASGEIADAVVDAESDPERGERIIAYVVLAPDGSLVRLERFCRAELPSYMQPSRIEQRPHIPRLASGKYDLPTLRGRPPQP